jgi:hypothetical protein
MLPSVGCTKCRDVSDEILARIAHETSVVRARQRIAGAALVATAFVVGIGVCSLGVLVAAKLIYAALLIVPPLGGAGAQMFERAKLCNHISRNDVDRIAAQLSESAGSTEPVAVPALRLND